MRPRDDNSSDVDISELLESPLNGQRRGPLLGSIIVVGLMVLGVVGLWMLGRGDGDDDAASFTESSVPATATTTTVEPVLLLADPEVFVGRPGPEPNMTPDVVEQPLVQLDGLTLVERTLVDGRGHLEVDSRIAVGRVADTSYRVLLSTGIGTFTNAPDDGSPSVCYSLSGYPSPAAAATDCGLLLSPSQLVALWHGTEEAGLYAWSGVPEAAASVVLVVDGRDVLWQRPISGVAAFEYEGAAEVVELRVLDASGTELGRSDRTPRIPEPDGPIAGYGDYSDYATTEPDWSVVWADVARCVTEYGYDTLSTENGIFSTQLPADWAKVNAVENACVEGMGLPTDGIHDH